MDNILAKRRFDFLLQVAMKYNSKNRGMTSGVCSYSGGCAIGQHLDKELNKKLDSIGTCVEHNGVFDKLPEWMKSLGSDFLQAIQTMHDCGRNWNEFGLSKEGFVMVKSIISKYVYDGKL